MRLDDLPTILLENNVIAGHLQTDIRRKIKPLLADSRMGT